MTQESDSEARLSDGEDATKSPRESTPSPDSTGDERRTSPKFDEPLAKLVERCAALESSLSTSLHFAEVAQLLAAREMHNFAKKFGTEAKESDTSVSVSFPDSHGRHALELSRNLRRATHAVDLVPRAFLVSLVAEYDAFLGQLMRNVFRRRPELLEASNKSIPFKDILSFDDMDAVRESLIDKEVETLLRESHSEQFEWMENRFDCVLRKGLPEWPQFIETTQRRHLFVHNDGRVSRNYIVECGKHGIHKASDAPDINDELAVDSDYFKRAHECIVRLGAKLCYVLWRKLLPGDIDECDNAFIARTYDWLASKRHKLAADILDFAHATFKKFSSEAKRRMMTINRAQAHKWLGQEDFATSILEKEDWSACGPEFQLCRHVLRDDFASACETMRNIGTSGPVRDVDYEHWPVFRAFRKSDEFQATFKEVFGRGFEPLSARLEIDKAERMQKVGEQLKRFISQFEEDTGAQGAENAGHESSDPEAEGDDTDLATDG